MDVTTGTAILTIAFLCGTGWYLSQKPSSWFICKFEQLIDKLKDKV